jgi:hypothetical protein
VLSWLPGAATLTNPWRFALPATLALCVAASLVAAEALARAGLRRRAALCVVAALGALHAVEIGVVPPFPQRTPLWREQTAPIARLLRADPTLAAVLDLSRHAKRNQLVHGKAIVGGWLPRLPRSVEAETERLLEAVRRATPEERPSLLGRAGIGAVILDDQRGWRILPDPTRPGGYREERLFAER